MSRADETAQAQSGSEQELMNELHELVVEQAPRRFTLCQVDLEHDVIGWGMSFDDHAVLCATEDRTLSTFGSAASALRLLSRRRDVRLVWVDAEADNS